MTKKEERQLELLKNQLEVTYKELKQCKLENIELKKRLGVFDFEGWNNSGIDDEIGSPWHVTWSDYILEFIRNNTFLDQTEEVLIDVLQKCFNAGIDFGKWELENAD